MINHESALEIPIRRRRGQEQSDRESSPMQVRGKYKFLLGPPRSYRLLGGFIWASSGSYFSSLPPEGLRLDL